MWPERSIQSQALKSAERLKENWRPEMEREREREMERQREQGTRNQTHESFLPHMSVCVDSWVDSVNKSPQYLVVFVVCNESSNWT